MVTSLVFVFVYSFSLKANAAADIGTAGGNIVSSNTIQVYFNNPGHNLASIDFSKFHIDVNTGGVSPLTPVSAVITTPGNPWVATLTFAGTPFSDTATAYDASHGLYVDALAVTDTNGDTNEVVAHGASLAVNDDQNPVFVSASATSNTNIAVTFSEDVAVQEANGSDFDLTANGVVITAAAVDGTDASIVNLTTQPLLNPDFWSGAGLDIALDAVRDISPFANSNASTQNQDVSDRQIPSTPTSSVTNMILVNLTSQALTLSSTGSTDIHYTVDGSTPTCTTGLTANPFNVTASTTVKAVGCDLFDNTSPVATFDYVAVVHSGGSGSPAPAPLVVSATPTLTVTPISTNGSEIIVPISISITVADNVIPGCDNRTTGFSTTTGKSCVVNTGTLSATPIIKYNFGNTILKNGSKGEAVKELQRFLNQVLNLGLVVDGKLGPKTIAVIKQWQKDNGLTADGLIGPKTKEKMLSSVN